MKHVIDYQLDIPLCTDEETGSERLGRLLEDTQLGSSRFDFQTNGSGFLSTRLWRFR